VFSIIFARLPSSFFYPARRSECRVVIPHKQATTPLGEKMSSALRVAPKKAPE